LALKAGHRMPSQPFYKHTLIGLSNDGIGGAFKPSRVDARASITTTTNIAIAAINAITSCFKHLKIKNVNS